jgi:Ca-activated chloride channel family protein
VTFIWPVALVGLAAVPLALLFHVLARRRRRAYAVRHTNLPVLAAVAGRRRRWRRAVPPALALIAIALLAIALARPEVALTVPRERATIVLALDTSGSMRATDVAPDRLRAAQQAARRFVRDLPRRFEVGVVSFASQAQVEVAPTADRRAIVDGIDRLQADGGTALGDAIARSVELVTATEARTAPDTAAVVLLSDGENTDGPDPLELAEIASSAGVRVYPIGLGRPEGTVLEIDGFQIATALDEPLLREIAARTDGRYFAAADEQALAAVYDSIELTWTVRAEHIEVTAALAAAAALLVLCGVGLSLTWFGRAV